MDKAGTNNVLSLVSMIAESFGLAHFCFDTWVLFCNTLVMLFAILLG
jgi:hypothetical protein